MNNGMYVGIDNLAHKVKKLYVGVNGTARKVKKIYIGVSGGSRLAWSSDPDILFKNELVTIDRSYHYLMSNNIYFMCATYSNNDGSSYYGGGRAYDKKTLTFSPINLTSGYSDSVTANNDSYAMVAGGYKGYIYINNIDLFDNSLTRTSIIGYRGSNGASVTLGACALIGGGQVYENSNYSYNSLIVAVNHNGVISNNMFLTRGKSYPGTAFNKTHVLFCGGSASKSTSSSDLSMKTVDAFDSNFTKTILSELANGASSCKGGNIGEYAIVVGGSYWGNTPSGGQSSIMNQTLQAYDRNLVKTTMIPQMPITLSTNSACGSLEGVSIISGDSTYAVYNNQLVHSVHSVPNGLGSKVTSANKEIYFIRNNSVNRFTLSN